MGNFSARLVNYIILYSILTKWKKFSKQIFPLYHLEKACLCLLDHFGKQAT